MAGTYRVTFDFLEISSFPAAAPRAPYQSWGTEKVYVDRDEPKFISLVHILEMRVVQADGKVSDPMVIKHWRQDWTYEPTTGRAPGTRSMGTPRGGAGRVGGRMVAGGVPGGRVAALRERRPVAAHTQLLDLAERDTWRPLPRREWSVRDDYQALIGTNRHTVCRRVGCRKRTI